MVDVYVRWAEEAEGVKLGEVPFTTEAFDSVLTILNRWGGIAGDLKTDDDVLTGQFVLRDDRAFFEVVVNND